MAFATSLYKQYYGKKAGIGFARAFELLGKKGLASAKMKGNWLHDFEEALGDVATVNFLCTWLEITGASSIEALRTKSPLGVEGVCRTHHLGVCFHGRSRRKISTTTYLERQAAGAGHPVQPGSVRFL